MKKKGTLAVQNSDELIYIMVSIYMQ